tara:strand:+ start:1530 stop:2660 length:1131 start_codon:yes stop_codon:yes gene_type:complete
MAYTTIDDSSAHHQTTMYTGNGGTGSITNGVGYNSTLRPDLLWIKCVENGSDDHCIFDSTRGVSERLSSETYAVADTGSSSDYLTAFNSSGFSLGSNNEVNRNNYTMIAWQWVANAGTRTTFTENGNNPAGGRQVNTTAGFSIVDYVGTGAAGTIAHGLGAVPHVMMVKARDYASDWMVYHHQNTAAPETDALALNEAGNTADINTIWNDTAPTSSVFTVGSHDRVNKNDTNYIAYLWTEIKGYSKFGKYTQNNNDDGPFAYTGFTPAWILIKANAGSLEWLVLDIERGSAFDNMNPNANSQRLDTTAVQNTDEETNKVSFYCNGFKCMKAAGATNHSSSGTMLYMAFAKHPLVSSGGIPSTAFSQFDRDGVGQPQ